MTDTAQTTETSETPKKFKVVAESGLFKNGKHYKKGEFIAVDKLDADGNLVGLSSKSVPAFLEAGDIEEVENVL